LIQYKLIDDEDYDHKEMTQLLSSLYVNYSQIYYNICYAV